jgi:hypothetical protein
VTLEYTVEESDVSAFLDYHANHSDALQELRRNQMYGYALLLAIFAIIFWFFGETAVAIAILVLGPIWAAWWPLRTRRLARRQAIAAMSEAPAAAEAGRYVLELGDEALLLNGPRGEHRITMGSVRRIVDLPSHLLIYVGTLQAIVVPRQTAKGDFESFGSTLRQRLASTSGSLPS